MSKYDTFPVNHLCYDLETFLVLVGEIELDERVIMVSLDNFNVWEGRCYQTYRHIKVLRDHREIIEILSIFCPLIQGTRPEDQMCMHKSTDNRASFP